MTSVKPAKPAPFILYEKSARGLLIAAANATARAAGLRDGMRVSDARASLPGLVAQEISRDDDADALRLLARWMNCISPRVSLDGPDGLMLETTGCDHLLAGETGLVRALSQKLAYTGYAHRIALAGTPGAAYALARHRASDGAPQILPAGAEQDGLADLPVQALRLSADAVTLLRRFGLTRIGQLYGIDRKALTRRFQSRQAADAVCLRLDQALGRRHEPVTPLRPPAEHACRLACPEPLTQAAGVEEGLRQLTEQLCADLSGMGIGAREFVFCAYHSDGQVSDVCVHAALPVCTPAHILLLFREKIGRIEPGFGIDLLLLEALRTGPMTLAGQPLSGEMATTQIDEAALCALADRISARLGEGTVTHVRLAARHPPDQAEQRTAFTGVPAEAAPLPPAGLGPRPVRMLAWPERVDVIAAVPDGPPLSFVWRRMRRRVVRSDGPERIAPEWWLHLPGGPDQATPLPRTRDFYRIEDAEGHRYWVFREGLYDDGRGLLPDWFVQGLFA